MKESGLKETTSKFVNEIKCKGGRQKMQLHMELGCAVITTSVRLLALSNSFYPMKKHAPTLYPESKRGGGLC